MWEKQINFLFYFIYIIFIIIRTFYGYNVYVYYKLIQIHAIIIRTFYEKSNLTLNLLNQFGWNLAGQIALDPEETWNLRAQRRVWKICYIISYNYIVIIVDVGDRLIPQLEGAHRIQVPLHVVDAVRAFVVIGHHDFT